MMDLDEKTKMAAKFGVRSGLEMAARLAKQMAEDFARNGDRRSSIALQAFAAAIYSTNAEVWGEEVKPQ